MWKGYRNVVSRQLLMLCFRCRSLFSLWERNWKKLEIHAQARPFSHRNLSLKQNNLCYRNKLDIKSTGKHVEIFTGPYNYNVNCAWRQLSLNFNLIHLKREHIFQYPTYLELSRAWKSKNISCYQILKTFQLFFVIFFFFSSIVTLCKCCKRKHWKDTHNKLRTQQSYSLPW